MAAEPLKVALVTGAARRIGRVIALDLAAAGWRVAVHHRSSASEAAEVVAAIQSKGGTAEAFAADLADPTAVEGLIPAVEEALGPVSLLINNASLFLYDDVASLEQSRWQRHHSVNLEAAVFLAKSLADRLPAGMNGHVINIIDQRVLKPTPVFFSLMASPKLASTPRPQCWRRRSPRASG